MKDTYSGHATTITELQGTAEQGRLVMAEVLDRLDAAFPAAAGRHRLGPGAHLVPLGGGSSLLIALAPASTSRDGWSGQLVLSGTLLDRSGLEDADVARALACLEAVPFTAWECDAFSEQLPLLAGLAKRLPDKPLGRCGLVIVGHLLSDLVVQAGTLIALGARPEAMTVLDLGYPHKLKQRVGAHLAGLGIEVLPASDMETALRLHVARVMEPSVVIDDGGHVAPVLMTLAPELMPEFAGLVEQSLAGIEVLERLGAGPALELVPPVPPSALPSSLPATVLPRPLPLPVFSVAQSKVKRGIEAHWIAESVVRSIRELLPGEGFDAAPALIIGFGTVGEQVAAVLRAQRMRVAVHDSEWPRLRAAHEAGYLTSPDLPALLDGHRPLLIVSATGRTGLGGEDLDFLAGDCFVAGVSGRASEIDVQGLAERAARIEDLGRVGMRYQLPGGPVTVLADGLPVNLPRGDAGSAAPARQSDLTLAAVAWGACALARPGHGFGPGPDVAATDASIAESGLVEKYYRLYGPAGGAGAGGGAGRAGGAGNGAGSRGRSRPRSGTGMGNGTARRTRGRARISEL